MSTNLSGEGALGEKPQLQSDAATQQQLFLSKYENNTPLYTTQKMTRDPEFKQYRDAIYEEMTENPAKLFDFFLEHNDVLNYISEEDEARILNDTAEYV